MTGSPGTYVPDYSSTEKLPETRHRDGLGATRLDRGQACGADGRNGERCPGWSEPGRLHCTLQVEQGQVRLRLSTKTGSVNLHEEIRCTVCAHAVTLSNKESDYPSTRSSVHVMWPQRFHDSRRQHIDVSS